MWVIEGVARASRIEFQLTLCLTPALASSAADLASGLAESAKSSAQKVLSLPSQAVGKVSESMFPSQSAIVSELEHSKELHGMRAGQVGSRVDIEEFAVTEGNPSAAVQVEEITLMEGTPGGVAVSEQSGEFIRKRAQVDREIVKESGPRAA